MMREGVFEAFQTPLWQILLIFAGFLVVGIGLLYFAWRADRHRRAEELRLAEEQFQRLATPARLTSSDIRTIEVLAPYLTNPIRKYLLLKNQSLFDQCTTLAVHEGKASPEEIAAIRFKLGFVGARKGRHFTSSTEIPEGASILIIKDIRPPERATTITAEPSAFFVEMERPELQYARESELSIVFNDATGVYQFETTVISHEGSILALRHSETLVQLQRRKYFRKEVSLPVYVRLADTEDKPVTSRFIEIGGGGASLANPAHQFANGQVVEVSFCPGGNTTMQLSAQIVRTSQGVSVIHVNFTEIRDESRDLLYSLLFSTPE